MPGIVRATVDKLQGSPYVASQSKVFVQENEAILLGDLTQAGDTTIEASTKVFIRGVGAHRIGDLVATVSPPAQVPSTEGSTKVFSE